MRTTTRAQFILEIELEILEDIIYKSLSGNNQKKYRKDFFNVRYKEETTNY